MKEREREREIEREVGRKRERDGDRERESERGREGWRERVRERARERATERDRERQKERESETERVSLHTSRIRVDSTRDNMSNKHVHHVINVHVLQGLRRLRKEVQQLIFCTDSGIQVIRLGVLVSQTG